MPPPPTIPARVPHPALAAVQARLAAHRDELTETLRRWADLNTGSDNTAGLLAFAEVLRDHAAFLPKAPETLFSPLNREPCALRWCSPDSDLPGHRPRVLLNGHLDTVFPADSPFQSCRLDSTTGRLHGPGVADMKGGLVILFAALRAFLETDLRDQLKWEVLLTFDEETGSRHNRTHLEEAAHRHDLGLTFESSPEVDSLVRNRLGTGRIDLHCRGRAAHAGRNFHAGRNAVLALADCLLRINTINTELSGAIVNVAHFHGGGPINVVPDLAHAALNIRAADSATQSTLLNRLHAIATEVALASDCELKVIGGFTRPPKVADAATDALLEACRVAGRSLGLELTWRDTGGASDGNILQAAGLPNVDNLGAVGAHLHSDAEYVEVDGLVTRAQLTATLLVLLASGGLDEPDRPFLDRLRSQSPVSA